jgi:hypothetical protein
MLIIRPVSVWEAEETYEVSECVGLKPRTTALVRTKSILVDWTEVSSSPSCVSVVTALRSCETINSRQGHEYGT